MNKTVKELIYDVLLGVVPQATFVILLMSPILMQKGIPFYGDESWYLSPSSAYWYTQTLPYSWVGGMGPVVNTETMRFLVIGPFSYVFGIENAVKLYIIVTASSAGFFMYYALKILGEEWQLLRTKSHVRLMASFGSLIPLLAFTNFGMIGAATAVAWAYSTLPLSFALLVRFVKKGELSDALLFGLVSIAGNTQPIWLHLITIIGLSYTFLLLLISRSKTHVMKRIVLLAIVAIGFNAFWLVPAAAGQLLRGGGILQTYVAERLISFDALRFLSHWNLFDVIMVGEHQYYFFWVHPLNYNALNAFIPIFSTLSILVFRKNRYVLFMALILLFGMFLTKGVNEPGGYLYYLLSSNLPYGVGALMRNPTKFVSLVTFSYAFLISLSLATICSKSSPKNLGRLSLKSSKFKYLLSALLLLLLISPITFGSILDLKGYTWPRYRPTSIPIAYDEVNAWLSSQSGDFKVMWMPSEGTYVWKPYVTSFPGFFSSKTNVYYGKIYPEPLKTEDTIGDTLKILGVKYIIYHGDSLDEPDSNVLQDLMNQKDLKVVRSFNQTFQTEDNLNNPLPIGQTGLEFSNSPFELIEPSELSRGKETELTVKYRIPKDIIDQGFQGNFWAGFNIAINAYPTGSVDISQRLFINDDYIGHLVGQNLVNETDGYAVYRVKIPNNYQGTAVDIYASLYNGGFRALTDSFFVARLTMSPRDMVVPFIILENEKYSGPIYTDGGTAAVTDVQKTSNVEWDARINASEPFVLVFTEPYDGIWKAYLNGKEIQHTSSTYPANVFTINETGILDVHFFYALQDYYNVGVFVTSVSIMSTILFHYVSARLSGPPSRRKEAVIDKQQSTTTTDQTQPSCHKRSCYYCF